MLQGTLPLLDSAEVEEAEESEVGRYAVGVVVVPVGVRPRSLAVF
jgi:hypothetical protein